MKNLKVLTWSLAVGNFVMSILISLYGMRTYSDYMGQVTKSLSKAKQQELWFKVVQDNQRFLQIILITLFLLFVAHIMTLILYRSYKQSMIGLILGIIAILLFFVLGAVIVSPLLFVSAGFLAYQLIKWRKEAFNEPVERHDVKVK
jgi:membrane glycosyltransferase